jgi:hypothetical protein
MSYVDAEVALIDWLRPRYATASPAVTFADELPYNLNFVTPLVVVERMSGNDAVITMDRPVLDIDVFHLSKALAKALARQVFADIRGSLPGKTIGGAVVSKVETVSGPTRAGWDDTRIRRVVTSVRLYLHQPL